MCQNAKTLWFGTAYFDGIWASKSKFQGKHHPLLVKSSSSFHSSLMGPTRCQKGLPTNSCPPSTHPPALVVGALFGNSWNPSWWVTKNCYFPLDKGNSYFHNSLFFSQLVIFFTTYYFFHNSWCASNGIGVTLLDLDFITGLLLMAPNVSGPFTVYKRPPAKKYNALQSHVLDK